MSLDLPLFSASDEKYFNYCYDRYKELTPDATYGILVGIGLPITLTAMQILSSYLFKEPLPTLDLHFQKTDLNSQISEKVGRAYASLRQSAKFGMQIGKAASKIGLLSVATFLILSRQKIPIHSTYLNTLLKHTFQWLPTRKNPGLLLSIGIASTLATSLATGYDLIRKLANNRLSSSNLMKKPVFNEELNRVVANLITGNQNACKFHRDFPSLLLSGPPGTGKTSMANWIAQQSQMNYVMISGSDLTQFINRSMHVTELNKLFQKIKNEGTPSVLFIDEAESILKNRNLSDNIHYAELLHAFLKQMEGNNNQFMLILATNRFDDIDSAVLDRMDFKLEIPLPAYNERQAILENLIQQHFSPQEQESLFPRSTIEALAKETEGFSGRRILKMVNFLVNMPLDSISNLDQVVKEYIGKQSHNHSSLIETSQPS